MLENSEAKTGYTGRFFWSSWNLHGFLLVLLSPSLTTVFLLYVLSLLNPFLSSFNKKLVLGIKKSYNVTYFASTQDIKKSLPEKTRPEKLIYYPLRKTSSAVAKSDFVKNPCEATTKGGNKKRRKRQDCDKNFKWDQFWRGKTEIIGGYS